MCFADIAGFDQVHPAPTQVAALFPQSLSHFKTGCLEQEPALEGASSTQKFLVPSQSSCKDDVAFNFITDVKLLDVGLDSVSLIPQPIQSTDEDPSPEHQVGCVNVSKV